MYVLGGTAPYILDAVIINKNMLTPGLQYFSSEETGKETMDSRDGLQNLQREKYLSAIELHSKCNYFYEVVCCP
jgi:hypothetical protein